VWLPLGMLARTIDSAPCYVTCKAPRVPCTPRHIVRKSASNPLILDDVALLRNVQTVQELGLCQCAIILYLLWKCGHTFRISLFLTLQICWMSAALCETFSRELPLNCSSSFWFLETSTSTPGCITTLRTIFSPMKFL
jgi:hypothetical protein